MAKYGELMIQAEIINSQINECKKQISEILNAPKEDTKKDK